jgi:hypothetical protein
MKRGQVWVETVIYTLIALVLIGAVLAFVKPKIEEMQDEAIVKQSMGILEGIDNLVLSTVRGGQGNKRIIDVSISKGKLIIDGEKDAISFYIESKYTYSQPGEPVEIAGITVTTEKIGSNNKITLTKDYSKSNYDIKVGGGDNVKNLEKSPTPYKISIYNAGSDSTKTQINIGLEGA